MSLIFVLGGYGGFGGRIARRLTETGHDEALNTGSFIRTDGTRAELADVALSYRCTRATLATAAARFAEAR